MTYGKTVKLIEMPFGLRSRVGASKHVFDGGPDPSMGRGNLEERRGRPVEQCKNGLTDQDAVWVEDSGGPKEQCVRCGSRLPEAKQFLGERTCPACQMTLYGELCKNG